MKIFLVNTKLIRIEMIFVDGKAYKRIAKTKKKISANLNEENA